jgi:adenylate cyclase
MTIQQALRVTPEDDTPTEVEVRLELQKMLASKDFDTSSRNRRFLTFAVEETLANRGNRIKAYNVALAVFDRSSDFDPLTDPIVRIEASRLRRSIEHYYLTGGRADRVCIAMPKGSYITTFAYANPDRPGLPVPEPITPIDVEEPAAEDIAATVVPVIEPRKPMRSRIGLVGMAALAFAIVAAVSTTLAFAPSQIQPASPAAHEPAILVLPFEYIGSDAGQAGMARAFTTEIIVNLTQSRSLAVFGTEAVIDAEQSPAVSVDYRLSGSVAQFSNVVTTIALLSDANTGQVIWSWRVQRQLDASGPMAAQSAMAKQAAEALSQNLTHRRIASKQK